MSKIEKPIETVTLSYAEYVSADTFPSKYFIVNALQQYVFYCYKKQGESGTVPKRTLSDVRIAVYSARERWRKQL